MLHRWQRSTLLLYWANDRQRLLLYATCSACTAGDRCQPPVRTKSALLPPSRTTRRERRWASRPHPHSSLVALDSTLPNLCACESPFHILLVPLRPDSPTKRLSVCPLPQNLVVPLPALGKKGGAVTADSPCRCTAESKDCRARSNLHVGDRYPIASRHSCFSPSF